MNREDQFYLQQPIAILGVSSNGKGFSASVYQELNRRGIRAFAVNPKGGSVQGQPIYKTLAEVPEPAQAAVILTKSGGALQALRDCAANGVEWVWLQGGSDVKAAHQLCLELGLRIVRGSCILLRVGGFPHNIHRFFHNLFDRRHPAK